MLINYICVDVLFHVFMYIHGLLNISIICDYIVYLEVYGNTNIYVI